jgi:hypothetical protein
VPARRRGRLRIHTRPPRSSGAAAHLHVAVAVIDKPGTDAVADRETKLLWLSHNHTGTYTSTGVADEGLVRISGDGSRNCAIAWRATAATSTPGGASNQDGTSDETPFVNWHSCTYQPPDGPLPGGGGLCGFTNSQLQGFGLALLSLPSPDPLPGLPTVVSPPVPTVTWQTGNVGVRSQLTMPPDPPPPSASAGDESATMAMAAAMAGPASRTFVVNTSPPHVHRDQ